MFVKVHFTEHRKSAHKTLIQCSKKLQLHFPNVHIDVYAFTDGLRLCIDLGASRCSFQT